MKKLHLNTFYMARLLLVFCLATLSLSAQGEPEANKVYEMRVYHVHEGKLADLHKRFREHTHQIFERLDMKVAAYWTPTQSPESSNTLIYIMEHPSEKAAKQRWKTFVSDPEWQKVFKASRVNGPLVKSIDITFMRATDFSPVK